MFFKLLLASSASLAAAAGQYDLLPTSTTSRTVARNTCEEYAAAYKDTCCGKEPSTEVQAIAPAQFLFVESYQFDGQNCQVEAGSHLVHAEAFSGAKVDALLTASECVPTGYADWQADARMPVGEFCAAGAFDGLQAMAIFGDGTMQTKNTGKTYMRTFINTEITASSSRLDQNPQWKISTSEATGGFGQPAPVPADMLHMTGAIEQFFDLDRETLAVINGGHAIKKVYTAHVTPYQAMMPADATSADLYAIVTEHSQLHQNVHSRQTERTVPQCDEAQSGYTPNRCGLSGHCGSKLSLKHEFSYVPDGETGPALAGVGPEDDMVFIAMEGHPGGGDVRGTIQVLDVHTGNLYQLPHLAVGVVEMAFTVSTGHPDYMAVVIEDYGVSACGSGWQVWIGKKDQTSDHFLDRNGLGINQGRLYRFVADSGETDMAAFLDWPASGRLSYAQIDRPGSLKPIAPVFSGNYTEFNAVTTNCAVTTDGSVPVRMTGEDKQEWGSVNPDKPNQWVIAETGLGRQLEVCLNRDPELCPHGELSSTLAFLEANFAEALANLETSTIESRNGNKLPESVVAKNFHVMADQVLHGPDRGTERGLSYVDSVFWLKGGRVMAAEDSGAPGGYNMAMIYDVATRKTLPIVGAIGSDNRKMNNVAMSPYGSFTGSTNQEMTGWFDASPALSVSVPFTPQDIYNAYDSRHLIVNNQMKGRNGCMKFGYYYTAQMQLVILPQIDWATVEGNPEVYENSNKYVEAFGKYRRRQLSSAAGHRKLSATWDAVCKDDWSNGHDDFRCH